MSASALALLLLALDYRYAFALRCEGVCPLTEQEKVACEQQANRTSLSDSGALLDFVERELYTPSDVRIELFIALSAEVVGRHRTALELLELDVAASEEEPGSGVFLGVANAIFSGVLDAINIVPVNAIFQPLLGIVPLMQTGAREAKAAEREFLKAVRAYRAELDTIRTRSIALVDVFMVEFYGALKAAADNGTSTALIVEAYEFITRLYDAAPSTRDLRNSYLFGYLESLQRNTLTMSYFVDRYGDAVIMPKVPEGMDDCQFWSSFMSDQGNCFYVDNLRLDNMVIAARKHVGGRIFQFDDRCAEGTSVGKAVRWGCSECNSLSHRANHAYGTVFPSCREDAESRCSDSRLPFTEMSDTCTRVDARAGWQVYTHKTELADRNEGATARIPYRYDGWSYGKCFSTRDARGRLRNSWINGAVSMGFRSVSLMLFMVFLVALLDCY